VDDFADESGFRVEIEYRDSADTFMFPPNTVEAHLDELVRIPKTRDECLAVKDWLARVFSVREGEEFVGSVGLQTEKDCTALPAE
jgi:hypothetical protein